MIITNIKMIKCSGAVLAYFTIVLDSCLRITDIKLLKKKEKLFIVFPEKKCTNKCYNCDSKNTWDANYCSRCGIEFADPIELTTIKCRQCNAINDIDNDYCTCGHTLPESNVSERHISICHPIVSDFRNYVTQELVKYYYA